MHEDTAHSAGNKNVCLGQVRLSESTRDHTAIFLILIFFSSFGQITLNWNMRRNLWMCSIIQKSHTFETNRRRHYL